MAGAGAARDHDCWRVEEPADANSLRAETGCSARRHAALDRQQSEEGLNVLRLRNGARLDRAAAQR